jgi:hypothetical protein
MGPPCNPDSDKFPATERSRTMPALPWTVAGPARPDTDVVVVLASRLRLRSLHHVPGFLRHALKIRRQVRRSAGALGVSLIAQPFARTFWTLSAWTGHDAISRFVGEEPHRSTMARYHERLEHADFVTWPVAGASLPAARGGAEDLWAEGRRRLAVSPGQ